MRGRAAAVNAFRENGARPEPHPLSGRKHRPCMTPPRKSQRWESNPQPPHYECGALPIEATLAFSPPRNPLFHGGHLPVIKSAYGGAKKASRAGPAWTSVNEHDRKERTSNYRFALGQRKKR